MKKLVFIIVFLLRVGLQAQTTQSNAVYRNEHGAIICIITNSKNNKGGLGFSVDQLPTIYGGYQEMKRFLHDNLIYPSNDFAEKKQGTVTLNFVITKEGRSAFISVVKSVSPAIDKEAIRLLKLLDWIPAFKKEKPIDVYYELKINFSIAKYKKQVKQRGFDTPLYTDLPTDTSLNRYQTAEQAPVFNCADKTFPDFVYSKLEYPDIAKRQFMEGDVQLSFVVEPNGQVSNIKILNKGLGGGCDNEAIRIIGLTKWKPAIRNNQYVRYQKTATVNFSLKNTFTNNNLYRQNVGGTMQ
jgi:TonB family protein